MSPRIIDCVQGSPEWIAARLGIATASNFHAILAKGEGKTRASYMRKLAAEVITEEEGESFRSPELERGHTMEVFARLEYSFMTETVPQLVGFVRNGDAGCSPDGFVDDRGMVEFKSKRADLLIDVLFKDKFPGEHIAQTQGGLWVCEREWIDLCIYWPKMPLFVKRAQRDEPYIAGLAKEVASFNQELADMVGRLRRYGERIAA